MGQLESIGCRGWNARASMIEYHSTVRGDGEEQILSQIIDENKEDILVSWRKMMLAHGGRTSELMTVIQFDKMAKAFLNEFIDGIRSKKYGNITIQDSEKLLRFLRKTSRDVAKQGFLPSYIANLVFCLKYVLTDLMHRYFKVTKKLSNETMAVYKLLDALGMYTFETYSKTREELLKQQQTAISLLQETRASRVLLKVDEGIVALPVMGLPDDEHNLKITKSLLEYVAKNNCKVVIFDLTNILSFSPSTTQSLKSAIKAVKLVGAEVLITGINLDAAQALKQTEVGENPIPLFSTLKEGIQHATALEHLYIS
jgi:rsbT co-antagonist protein RsbR